MFDFITVTISLWKTERLVSKTGDFWKQLLRFNFKKCNPNIRWKQEKILDPRNTHEKTFWTHEILTRKVSDPQWHYGTRTTDFSAL